MHGVSGAVDDATGDTGSGEGRNSARDSRQVSQGLSDEHHTQLHRARWWSRRAGWEWREGGGVGTCSERRCVAVELLSWRVPEAVTTIT